MSTSVTKEQLILFGVNTAIRPGKHPRKYNNRLFQTTSPSPSRLSRTSTTRTRLGWWFSSVESLLTSKIMRNASSARPYCWIRHLDVELQCVEQHSLGLSHLSCVTSFVAILREVAGQTQPIHQAHCIIHQEALCAKSTISIHLLSEELSPTLIASLTRDGSLPWPCESWTSLYI